MDPCKAIVGSIVCVALAAPACAREAPTPAPLRAAADDGADLSGAWETDWGKVTFNGLEGSYTDTFGPEPGYLKLRRTGDHRYTGIWGESKARHGTLTVTLSADGRRLTGAWAPDADVTLGGREGGPIDWVKKR